MAGVQFSRRAISPLLGLCIGLPDSQAALEDLRSAAAQMTPASWPLLVESAAYHGMAPLLARCLEVAGVQLPPTLALTLHGQRLRARHANGVLAHAAGDILRLYQSAAIPFLLLKGAALAHLIYPDPALRPMADIDLWVHPCQALRAYALLAELGYEIQPPPDGQLPDNQHLFPALRIVDDLAVGVDVHFQLFNPGREHYLGRPDFAACLASALLVSGPGWSAPTLPPAELLWHIYGHGVHQSLRFPGHFRLRCLADLRLTVDKFLGTWDWEFIFRRHPPLRHVLSLLHWLCPWPSDSIQRLKLDVRHRPVRVGELYRGYPSTYLHDCLQLGIWQTIGETAFPPQWWLRLYDGLPSPRQAAYWAGLLRHEGRILANLGRDCAGLLTGQKHITAGVSEIEEI